MTQFRILTYNIHKGIGGVDRRYRWERILETIQHYNPDILHLQEVDDGVPRSKFHRQVDLLGDKLDIRHREFQTNVKVKQGFYGNAILSRFPLHDTRHIDLSIPLKKKRRAILTHCRLPADGKHTRTVVLVNFHLGLAGFERKLQIQKVLEDESFKRIHRATPTIVAGDYNDVWGKLGAGTLGREGFSLACNAHTFPAILPVRPLDRIYYRGDLELDHAFPGHTGVARQASDHLPVIADFILRED